MSRIVDDVRDLLGPHDPAPREEPPSWTLRAQVLNQLDDAELDEPPRYPGIARRLAVAAVVVVLGGTAVLYLTAGRDTSGPDGATTADADDSDPDPTPLTTVPTTIPPDTTLVPPTTLAPPPTTTPPAPVGSGWPDETNTGPAPGTQFAPMAGGGTIRQDGLVVENVQLDDGLDIYANDVIRNCRIEASGYWAVQLRDGYTNLTIENCEIYGNGVDHLEVAVKNIGDGQIDVRRNDIHTSTDAFMGGRGLVEDNYIHDLVEFPGDHVDGIQSNGSSSDGDLVIRHNTVFNPVGQTSAIILAPTFSPLDRITIENNLLAGGGYTLYGGEAMAEHPYGVTNLVVRNNVFSRRFFPKGGYYGPVAHWDHDAPGNVWSNNTWEDTGEPVNP